MPGLALLRQRELGMVGPEQWQAAQAPRLTRALASMHALPHVLLYEAARYDCDVCGQPCSPGHWMCRATRQDVCSACARMRTASLPGFVQVDNTWTPVNDGEDVVCLRAPARREVEHRLPPALLATALMPSTLLFWRALLAQFADAWVSVRMWGEQPAQHLVGGPAFGPLKCWVPVAVGAYCKHSTLAALLFDASVAHWGAMALCRLNLYGLDLKLDTTASLDVRMLGVHWPRLRRDAERAPSLDAHVVALCNTWLPHWVLPWQPWPDQRGGASTPEADEAAAARWVDQFAGLLQNMLFLEVEDSSRAVPLHAMDIDIAAAMDDDFVHSSACW